MCLYLYIYISISISISISMYMFVSNLCGVYCVCLSVNENRDVLPDSPGESGNTRLGGEGGNYICCSLCFLATFLCFGSKSFPKTWTKVGCRALDHIWGLSLRGSFDIHTYTHAHIHTHTILLFVSECSVPQRLDVAYTHTHTHKHTIHMFSASTHDLLQCILYPVFCLLHF